MSKVTSSTLERTKGQRGFMPWLGGMLGGGAVFAHGAGLTPAVAMGVALKYLHQAARSPGWKLASARLRNSLADAITIGDAAKVSEELSKIPGFNSKSMQEEMKSASEPPPIPGQPPAQPPPTPQEIFEGKAQTAAEAAQTAREQSGRRMAASPAQALSAPGLTLEERIAATPSAAERKAQALAKSKEAEVQRQQTLREKGIPDYNTVAVTYRDIRDELDKYVTRKKLDLDEDERRTLADSIMDDPEIVAIREKGEIPSKKKIRSMLQTASEEDKKKVETENFTSWVNKRSVSETVYNKNKDLGKSKANLKDGSKVEIEDSNHQGSRIVGVYNSKGEEISNAEFSKNTNGTWSARTLATSPKWRRKGAASTIYDHMTERGFKIISSDEANALKVGNYAGQTESGEYLWNKPKS